MELNTDRDDLTSDTNTANTAQATALAQHGHDQSVAYASAAADLPAIRPMPPPASNMARPG